MTAQADSAFTKILADASAKWDAADSTQRLWKKDDSLWTGDAGRWLGWIDAVDIGDSALATLAQKIESATPPNTTGVLLIGMGGSSLAPEVIAKTLAAGKGGRSIRVLDSTHPTAVIDAFAHTDWARTVVIVASKSGSTLEPDILLTAALAASREKIGDEAPRRTIAITDPGSKLGAFAAKEGFAAIIEGEPSIGGRFSALSPFGLVPAALHGLDLVTFMSSARSMAAECRTGADRNPGVTLGIFLGEAARAGRDKCTLILPPSLAALGAWIEQLIAESTGKHGVAILPVDGEPVRAPGSYGKDRAFVHVRDGSSSDPHAHEVSVLVAAGHPVFTVDVRSPDDLAGEFFRWEFATAVAGSLMQLNPFDQPDVESAKIATRSITDAYENGASAPPVHDATNAELVDLLSSIKAGDYFALLAFMPSTAKVVESLQRTRLRVRDAKNVATMLGIGPRFLHSTGQAFKGGPNSGVFVQLTCDYAHDLGIPGRRSTFGTVVSAQAAGDLQVLKERGRRAIHVHLSGDLAAALASFDSAVAAACG